jgi:hypothetical protein
MRSRGVGHVTQTRDDMLVGQEIIDFEGELGVHALESIANDILQCPSSTSTGLGKLFGIPMHV